MTFSMPPRALRLVAAILGLASLGAFTLGVMTADAPARLPGERQNGGPGAAILATDATPLGDERIEGPPPPPELTPEEKAKLEAEKKAREEAARAKAAEAAAQTPTPAATPDQIGDVLQAAPQPKAPPPPEEPLF